MGGWNINWQFREAIADATAFKESRHSAKNNNNIDTYNKIYGGQSKKNIQETANQFAKFLKAEHKDIRQARNITPEVVQEFLDYKAQTCNHNTIYRYRADINKLQECIINRWCNRNSDMMEKWNPTMPTKFSGFNTTMRQEDKNRDVWMDKDTLTNIKNYVKEYNKTDTLYNALSIGEILGLRVGELADLRFSDLDLKNNTVTIQMHEDTKKGEGPKGGRTRVLELNQTETKKLKEIVGNVNYTDAKILGVSKAALHKAWNRLPEELTKDFKDAGSSFHSIRKMVATEKYDNVYQATIEKTGNPEKAEKEATQKMNSWLGHGEDRQDLKRVYRKR